jgi:predicted glycoside hydrolase/deacetylase ChbG (UPF0249 family)
LDFYYNTKKVIQQIILYGGKVKIQIRYLVLLITIITIAGCSSGSNVSDYSKPLAVRLGYSDKDILVIVHADDIGMHVDETDGALTSMKSGMCKTGSVMVVCPDFDRTAAIYKKNPDLDLGLHFTLNSEWKNTYTWKPLLAAAEVPSLYAPNAAMWPDQAKLGAHLKADEAKLELAAQLKKAFDSGIKLTHIDSHMGSYFMNPELFDYAVELSKKYNLAIATWDHPQSAELRQQGFIFPDSYTCIYKIDDEANNPDLRRSEYYKLLASFKPGVHEIIVHIANVTEELARIIEMPYIRSGDYNVWTSAETKKYADSLGITFIGFRELQALQAKNWKLKL